MATHEELVNKVHAVVNSDPGVLRAHERFLEAMKTDDLAKRLGTLQYLNSEMKYAGELETARAMKQDGLPVENICRYTGLSEQEVAAL